VSARCSRSRRRGLPRGVPWASLLLLVTVFLGVNTASSAAARPIETGVTAVDIVGLDGPLGFEKIREAGARWTRAMIVWPDVAPDSQPENWDPTDPADPNYDWSYFDQQIRWTVESGVEPLVSIFSAPEWAERCKTDLSKSLPGTCNPDPEMFADFAEAAARRYSGDFGALPKVTYWKVWNEPNLGYYLMPQVRRGKKVSPGLYRSLVNKMASRVKGVDPANQIVGGGLGPIGGPGRIAPLDFMRRLLCLKGTTRPVRDPSCRARSRFDIWAHNAYTTGRPTHSAYARDDVSMGDLPEMKNVLRAGERAKRVETDRSNVPFWITEMSWDSKGPDPKGVPMNRLKVWVSEAIFRAWKAGVSKFFWLSLRDWPRIPGDPRTIDAGLYFRGPTLAEDRPKPILQSFRFPFVSFRVGNGIRVWGRTPESGPGRIKISFRNRGAWRSIGSIRAGSNGVFSGVVRTSVGRDRKGRVKAELVSGRAAPMASVPFPLTLDRVRYQKPFGS
jgi:hypothetical protein